MIITLDRSQLNDNNNSFPFHDPATASKDCNVAMTSQGVELVTGRQVSAADLRTAARQAYGPTGNTFTKNAFQAEGITVQQYRLMWADPTQTVRDLLTAGWFVTLYIDYGVFTQAAPQNSSDPSFTGYHAVGLSGFWHGKLGWSCRLHDPLADGRHPSTPKGVQNIKFSWVRDAAYAYTAAIQKPAQTVQGWAVLPK